MAGIDLRCILDDVPTDVAVGGCTEADGLDRIRDVFSVLDGKDALPVAGLRMACPVFSMACCPRPSTSRPCAAAVSVGGGVAVDRASFTAPLRFFTGATTGTTAGVDTKR